METNAEKQWIPYGNNILVKPQSRDKIIGDTARFFLFGEVLNIGDNVSKSIQVGDIIGYTLWGLNKLVETDGTEHFFIQDNPDFVLGVKRHA